MNPEDVSMRLVATRRRRAAKPHRAVVVAQCARPRRQQAAVGLAGVLRQRMRVGRNVHHDPMPETTARRRVGVVDGQREAFGFGRHAFPLQRRRKVFTINAKCLLIEFMRLRKITVSRELTSPDTKISHGTLPPLTVWDWLPQIAARSKHA